MMYIYRYISYIHTLSTLQWKMNFYSTSNRRCIRILRDLASHRKKRAKFIVTESWVEESIFYVPKNLLVMSISPCSVIGICGHHN